MNTTVTQAKASKLKLNDCGLRMIAPTSAQIDAETKKLETFRHTTPDTYTGRLIHDQLKAQILVLSKRMSNEERLAEFSGGNERVAEAALNVWEWMQGDGYPPESEMWPVMMAGAEKCVCEPFRSACPCLTTGTAKAECEMRKRNVALAMKRRREMQAA